MIRAVTFTLIASFGFSAFALGQSPQLNLPEFTQLRSSAIESVDISLGESALKLAGLLGQAADKVGPGNDVSMLKSLQALDVRHYEFASDFAYPKEKLDLVRAQLAAAGWSSLVHVHDGQKSESVDISLSMEHDRITGVAIVVSEPREFTIVHAVGNLSANQVNDLRRQIESHGGGDVIRHSGWTL